MAAVAPSFNQQAPQAPVYQPMQQVPGYPPPVYPPPNYQQASNAQASQQPRNQAPRQNAPRRLYKTCPPIPMMFTELYPYLVQRGLVTTRALGPPPNPLPSNYNAAAHCLFHEGAPGHDLENCYAFKNLVRDLMERKILSFNDPPPNVKTNPLPTHGAAVNAVNDSFDENLILDVSQIKTPLKMFHSKLFEAGLVSMSHIRCARCKDCDKGCVMVQKDVQKLIDDGFLRVGNKVKKAEVVAVEPIFDLPEPRGGVPVFNMTGTISAIPVFSIPQPVTPWPLIIQKPSLFPSSDPKVVPWKYDVTAIDKES